MPRNGPQYNFRPEVARYLAPGVTYDPLRQPLYDRLILATGVVGTQQFFQIPVGQGSPAKTELDTNMRLAGQIPSQHVFEVWSPRVVIAPVSLSGAAALGASNPLEDVHDLIHGGFLRFRIVSQEKLLCPLWFLPAGAGTFVGGAASGTLATFVVPAVNGIPSNDAALRLDPFPVIIPPLQSFLVEITFPAAITLSANVNAWVTLDGILHRPALP